MSYELDSHIQENTYSLNYFRKPVKQDHLTNPVGNYLFFDPHANCVVIPPVQPDRRGSYQGTGNESPAGIPATGIHWTN